MATDENKPHRITISRSNFRQFFARKSKEWKLQSNTEQFARKLDDEDDLKSFRQLFSYPLKRNLCKIDLSRLKDVDEEAIYFCGQSLGLPLKNIESYSHQIFLNWAERGVQSHFEGCLPAAECDLPLKENMAYLVGAEKDEIVLMNSLTVNIHVMLSSFYNPSADRYKILMLHNGFPSDRFAVQSQVKLRGLDPNKSIIFLTPKKNEETLKPNEILSTIEREGKSIALIFLEGVHYYTGQLFDMKEITRVGHKHGCIVGFDLAHAAGNVRLNLHDWNVDFGLWCTYKYMNAGAGSLSGVFIHNKFIADDVKETFPMLKGWWGVDPKKKFAMEKEFVPAEGADRFKLSNPSPFLAVMLLANLEIFKQAGVDSLLQKQWKLTGYLEYLINVAFPRKDKMEMEVPHFTLITPADPRRRGCQLSLKSSVPLDIIEEELQKNGIVCDIRLPSVIRVTPVPLYNTFQEVFEFVRVLKDICHRLSCGSPDGKVVRHRTKRIKMDLMLDNTCIKLPRDLEVM